MTTANTPGFTPAFGPYTVAALAALPAHLATADLSTATPAQIDEALRTLGEEAARFGGYTEAAKARVRRAVGQRPTERREGPARARRTVVEWPTRWSVAFDEALARRTEAPIAEALAYLDALNHVQLDIHDRSQALHVEFDRRGGWTRYYRVANTGGHVHTTTACRTTYASTAWTWPTQLSGATHADVVGAAGRFTCLACFPDVRADILADRPIMAERFETPEQTDERMRTETRAAIARAEKVRKGVTADGSPLVVTLPRNMPGAYYGSPYKIATERAAELRYVEWAALVALHPGHPGTAAIAEVAETVLGALAAKRGSTVEAQRAALAPKVTRKARQL